ncbi:MAG: hypothetical protein Q4F25_06500, partial [Eubacteriales bacterium]|nr:hypothetical protein [Eubacteriales bacterium]
LDENGDTVEIKEDIDYGESSVYRFEMKNNFKDYGAPDQAQLSQGGFSSKEFDAKGNLQDAEPDMYEEQDSRSSDNDYDDYMESDDMQAEYPKEEF